MDRDTAANIVAPFYDALNQPASKDVAALVQSVASPDWRSYAGENASKSRDEFIAQVKGFGKLLPDLAWSTKEIFSDGDRIIVRSEASGTPAGEFMGAPHTGKRFSIMTIDIHTVREGKLIAAHHTEDWIGALRQLKA